jgi:hypothetical protein
MVMAPPNAPAGGPPNEPPPGRLFDLLAQVDQFLVDIYGPEFEFELVGRAPGRRPIRIVCPRRTPPPRHAPPDGETNADIILQVLSEADRPLTVVELAYRARGGEPTGAMRDALQEAGQGPPGPRVAGPAPPVRTRLVLPPGTTGRLPPGVGGQCRPVLQAGQVGGRMRRSPARTADAAQ